MPYRGIDVDKVIQVLRVNRSQNELIDENYKSLDIVNKYGSNTNQRRIRKLLINFH